MGNAPSIPAPPPIKDPISEIKGFFDGMKDTFDKIKNFFTNFDSVVLGPIENFFKNSFAPITNFFNNFKSIIIDPITDNVKNILNVVIGPIINFINKVKTTFDKVKQKFIDLGDSLKGMGDGVKVTFENLGKSIKTEWKDVQQILDGGVQCLTHTMNNFRECIIYWIFDMIGQLLYSILILFPIWLIYIVTAINLEPYVKIVISIIKQIDDIIKSIFKFSVIHFPDDIIDKCYTCGGVDFNGYVKQLKDDNNTTIPNLMNESKSIFDEAGHKFLNVFTV